MNTTICPPDLMTHAAPRYWRHHDFPRCDEARVIRLREAVRTALSLWSDEEQRVFPSSSGRERRRRRYYRAEARYGLTTSHAAYIESLLNTEGKRTA